MLLSNSRIEKNNKIIFYEQDILMDNHIYSGDIQITLNVDYVCSGIGIALISDEGLSLSSSSSSYLFRIGHSDYSIIKRINNKAEVIENGPVINIKPFKENLVINLKKINNMIFFYVNNELISKRNLPTELDSFNVGYYSNAGNIINSISIASEVPDGWIVNMDNTNGGYIKFSPDKFSITNCQDKAEIEQVNIKLKANKTSNDRYYLKFNKSKIDNKNDIKQFVFLTDDDRYHDEEKNLLIDGESFYLDKDSSVSLKFTGTIGSINSIQITDSKDDFYVGTEYESAEVMQSLINIKTKDIKKIEFDCTIHGIPTDKNEKYGFIRDEKDIYKPDDHGIKLKEEYQYIIDLEKNTSTFKLANEIGSITIYPGSIITILENMDSVVTKLLLYKTDGTIVDIIGQDTKKQYVPASITSPIIVTTETGEPLDLSSSYRVNREASPMFRFTNVEREIFEPANKIQLEKLPSTKLDTIIVYGILKDSNTYKDKIFDSLSDDIKEIDSYCDSYEVIREPNLYRINKETGTILITDKNDEHIKSKYKEIVVDYLKHNSYSINYKHELNSYEIDISTSENTKVYYDGIKNEDDQIVNANKYKILTTDIRNNSYIVLKGR